MELRIGTVTVPVSATITGTMLIRFGVIGSGV